MAQNGQKKKKREERVSERERIRDRDTVRFFLLPYLALTLVLRQIAWLGIIFHLGGDARAHNSSSLDPFYSQLFIPKARKNIWQEELLAEIISIQNSSLEQLQTNRELVNAATISQSVFLAWINKLKNCLYLVLSPKINLN